MAAFWGVLGPDMAELIPSFLAAGPSSTAHEDFEVFSSSLTTAMHDSSPDAGMTAVLERYLEPPIDRGMAWNRLAMIQHGNPPTEVLAGMYTRHPDDFGGLENLIDVRLL